MSDGSRFGCYLQQMKMKMTSWIIPLLIISAFLLYSCKTQTNEKSDEQTFEEILNDPRINSREVGEREGIEFFQYMNNGKTGFRDLDGEIVIEAIYESAEMFSEGYSAVELDNRWGLIDKSGKVVIEPVYSYLGSMHEGLMSFRENDKYGFVNVNNKVIIKPQFDWVDEFSEELCVFRNDSGAFTGLNGYVNKEGEQVIKAVYPYARKFENGVAMVQIEDEFTKIDINGKQIKEKK